MTENDKDKSKLPAEGNEPQNLPEPENTQVTESDGESNDHIEETLVSDSDTENQQGAETDKPDKADADAIQATENLVDEPLVMSDKKSRSPWALLFIVTAVLLVAGAAGGYWVWQQLQQQVASLQTAQQTLSEELQASRSQLSRLENLNQNTNTDWQEAVQSLESLVIQSAQRLNAQANRTENRWPLEEALTLARLANQRLQLDASASVAIGLLKSADVILAEQDQAAVLPIRRQFAADILALQSTPAADVNGLYFQLEAVAGEIKELVWVPKPTSQTAIPDNTDPVAGFWQSLKQVVVVSRLDVPMQAPPLQSDFERWRQHTLLLIEQTQLALLARNQALFNAALRQTEDQLLQMISQFDLQALQSALTEMQGATLNPDWPDVNTSIEALEIYLSEQVNAEENTEAETTEGNE